MSLYENDHRCQYDYSDNTSVNGCTWTSCANGIDASTGGRRKLSPDYVEAQVDRDEQQNPGTPGWSLTDAALAMSRLGVPFENRQGGVWADVVSALDREGCYVILQGDSDQFSDSTCSGPFNGDHCIGVHPDQNSSGKQRINDSICDEARYEYRSELRQYAEKFAKALGEYPRLRFGVFTEPVPTVGDDDDMGQGTSFTISSEPIGMATTTKAIGLIPTQGGPYYDVAKGYDRHVYAKAKVGDGKYAGQAAYLVLIPGGGEDTGLLLASAATFSPYAQDGTRDYDVKVTVGGDTVTGKVSLP